MIAKKFKMPFMLVTILLAYAMLVRSYTTFKQRKDTCGSV